MEAFGRALRALPGIIADNAGYDSADLVAQLRSAHAEGKNDYGLDMDKGVVANVCLHRHRFQRKDHIPLFPVSLPK